MKTIETKVVILANSKYNGGTGYNGPEVRQLGWPEGPFLPGIAKILVRQLMATNPKLRLRIVDYKPL